MPVKSWSNWPSTHLLESQEIDDNTKGKTQIKQLRPKQCIAAPVARKKRTVLHHETYSHHSPIRRHTWSPLDNENNCRLSPISFLPPNQQNTLPCFCRLCVPQSCLPLAAGEYRYHDDVVSKTTGAHITLEVDRRQECTADDELLGAAWRHYLGVGEVTVAEV